MKKLNKIITMIMACALVMGLALTPALAMELADADVSSGTLAAGTYEVTKDVNWASQGNITLAAGDTTFNMGSNTTITMGGALVVGTGANLTVTGAASEPTPTNSEVGATPNPTAQIVSKGTATQAASDKGDYAVVALEGNGNLKAENVAFVSEATGHKNENGNPIDQGIVNNGTGLVDLDNVTVESKGGTGILLRAGGTLDADHSTISGNYRGVGLQGGSTGTIDNCIINAEESIGIFENEKSKLTATNVMVNSVKSKGFSVNDGATATVRGKSTIEGKTNGIYVSGGSSNVTAEGVTVKSAERVLSVQNGATAQISDSAIKGARGILVDGKDAAVIATNVEIESEIYGLCVQSDKASANVTNSKIITTSANSKNFAVGVCDGSTVTLNGTAVEGKGVVAVRMVKGFKGNGEPTLILGAETTLNDGIAYYFYLSNVGTQVGGEGYVGDNPQTVGTIVKYDGNVEYVGSTEVPQKVKDASCPKDGETVETPTGTWTAAVTETVVEGTNEKTASVVWSFTPAPQPPVVYIPSVLPETDPTDENTEIGEDDVPLAGMVSVEDLVDYLFEDEDAKAKFVAWAIENGYIESEEDLEEIVTYGLLRTVMNAYRDYLNIEIKFECDGKDDDIVMNCGELIEAFLKKVKA